MKMILGTLGKYKPRESTKMTEPVFTQKDSDELQKYARMRLTGWVNSDEANAYAALVEKKKRYDEYTADTPENRLKNVNKRVEEQRTYVEGLKRSLQIAKEAFTFLCGEQVDAEEALEKHAAYQKAKSDKLKALAEEETAVEAQLVAIRKRKDDLRRDTTPMILGEGL